MKTTMKVLLISAAVLVAAGIIGAVVFFTGGANSNAVYNNIDDEYYGYYRQGGMIGGRFYDDDTWQRYSRFNVDDDSLQDSSTVDTDDDTDAWPYDYCGINDWSDDSDYGYFGRGMMGRYFRSTQDGETLDLEALEDNVNEYIDGFDEKLAISDIFVFEDSDYYFSIVEEKTGLGAFELLVDPYTGDVYPEMGPNMMWNLKYGMHATSNYGIMNGRGMMGRYNYSDSYAVQNDGAERNTVSYNEALGFAEGYLQNGYTVSGEGHEFYGYYTFHTQLDGEEAGMMSVNGFTGDVWYHTWHGELIEIVSGHGH